MAIKPDHPTQRRCLCGGANPNCLQCGGKGFIEPPGVRSIMAGPAGVRRRLPVSRESLGTIQGPPEPIRCPHCGLEVLHLAVHLTEAHPEKPQRETAAEREAREQEEARQAVVAAEIARREAEAAQRKAEARARRQEVEGPQSAVAWPGHARGTLQMKPLRQHSVPGRPADAAAQADPTAPPGAPDVGSPSRGRWRPSGNEEERRAGAESRLASPEDEAWERMRRALAERTVLTGVIRSRRPFGVFVNLGGIEGLVRTREMHAEDAGREAPGPQDGQTVKVVVIGMNEDTHRVELSMRRACDPRTPLKERGATGPEARPAEGPMALAFRLAREKKKQAE
jgi:predicted RNA-binding protein with RPS1 domain